MTAIGGLAIWSIMSFPVGPVDLWAGGEPSNTDAKRFLQVSSACRLSGWLHGEEALHLFPTLMSNSSVNSYFCHLPASVWSLKALTACESCADGKIRENILSFARAFNARLCFFPPFLDKVDVLNWRLGTLDLDKSWCSEHLTHKTDQLVLLLASPPFCCRCSRATGFVSSLQPRPLLLHYSHA